jgi:hypothetical protein
MTPSAGRVLSRVRARRHALNQVTWARGIMRKLRTRMGARTAEIRKRRKLKRIPSKQISRS